MTLQIGSLVRPTAGPHKNQVHEVVHIFEDGHANIRPVEGECLYEDGLVTCDPKLLQEEFIVEEYQEPYGHWFTSMSEKQKTAYRKNHPDAQGTYGHAPGSVKHYRALSQAHEKYADFHKDRLEHHEDKRHAESQKTKPDYEAMDHHSSARHGHATEFHNHTMAAAHYGSLARGGSPSYDKWIPKRHNEVSPAEPARY
jgi:hypothetical protein